MHKTCYFLLFGLHTLFCPCPLLTGLYIWTADGEKQAMQVPQGCLLVQAGAKLALS